jgi:hypothetical protein
MAALVELVSLALLLINLATVHLPAVASLLGPVHGCAYLFVIGATIRESLATKTRLRAVVPGIGGLLVIQRLTKTPGAPARDGRSLVAHNDRAAARHDGAAARHDRDAARHDRDARPP